MHSWDATPTPWSDPAAPLDFGNATPTPWADPAPLGFPGFGSLTRLTRIVSGAEEQYVDPASTPSENKADMGRNLLRGAYGPTLDEDLVKISDVPIKNTFIDGLPEESEQPPAIFKTTSAPMVFGARAKLFSPQQTRQQLEPTILQVEPQAAPQPVSVTQAAPSRVTLVDSNGFPSKELPSVGSALHGTGQCRPCAWFHKPQGCARGWECRHCHACDADELRNRKKDKVAILRAQEKAEKVATQQVPSTRVFHVAPVQCSRPLALSRLV
jgi:hypothetical protein